MKLRLLLKRPLNPEFVRVGLALQNWSFHFANVRGDGGPTKTKAFFKWFRTFWRLKNN